MWRTRLKRHEQLWLFGWGLASLIAWLVQHG